MVKYIAIIMSKLFLNVVFTESKYDQLWIPQEAEPNWARYYIQEQVTLVIICLSYDSRLKIMEKIKKTQP